MSHLVVAPSPSVTSAAARLPLRSLVAALVQSAVLLPVGGAAAMLVPTWATAQVAPPVAASPLVRKAVPAKRARKLAAAQPAAVAATAPINETSTGATGATGNDSINGGTGGTGGTGGSFSQAVGADWQTDDPSQSAVAMTSNGGAGGVGVDRTATSGNGGIGGAAGPVSLLVSGKSTQVSNGASALPVIALASNGGVGGAPGMLGQEQGAPGRAGAGGAGTSVSLQVDDGATLTAAQAWNGSTPGTTAVMLSSTGGAGGAPAGGAQTADFVQVGQPGGDGGRGGDISLAISAAKILSKGAALVAVSQGGAGSDGEGSDSETWKGKGGAGGVGGVAGNIVASIGSAGPTVIKAVGGPAAATGATIPLSNDGSTVAQASFIAAGVQLQSLGGAGGAGGSGDGFVGEAGPGGAAGNGGSVTLTMKDTTVTTSGYAAAAIVTQSVGGSGGNGPGAGGAFAQKGGNGGTGGNGAAVSVQVADGATSGSYIATVGEDSLAIVAQSIGGGGGVGGSVQAGSFIAGVSIGGSAESGGTGGAVSVGNGSVASGANPPTPGLVITTKGEHSSAIVAQSIGGGGGTGGSAISTVVGPFSYAVGGQGGSGGDAGVAGTLQVSTNNEGIVSTSGNHAKGMIAQAVGGGGGDGGSASSLTASALLNITVAVGGKGGTGGDSGDVASTNDGQIMTSGGDAWAMLAQSVGGGGGNGGMSKATAFQVVGGGDIPSVSIDVSVGGQGGTGGTAGNSSATNNGLIFTGGPTAHGLFAQSVGGGGGNGGDSTAMNAAVGSGTSINVTVAVGGNGGGGTAGGDVSATNASGALIWTLGDSARGIFAQSVGGGGGTGGSAKDETLFLSKGNADGANINLALGGSGGGAGPGGAVSATNDGNILTLGDSGDAIFAQSVGGGGGVAGGAKSVGSPGKNTKTVKVGGADGLQSDGGTVKVVNTGAVLTYGADASGIYAQSIGGGGGKAGTSTAVLGKTSLMSVQDFLKSSSAPAGLQTYADGVVGWAAGGWSGYGIDDLVSLASAYATANNGQTQPDTHAGANSTSNTVLVVGGGNKDGNAAPYGDGGIVTVTNSGRIATNGPAAAGIWAQSVGGGGGQGGATDINDAAQTPNPSYIGQVSTGGQGYNVGQGGAVTVTNTALITTAGDLSYGVLAQSIAGGGGHATITNSADTSTAGHTALNLGGDSFASGDGGSAVVFNTTTNHTASITTQGNDAIGVLAQSIGGGGGVIAVMHPTAGSNGTTTSGTNPGIDPTGSLASLQIGGTSFGSPSAPLPECHSYSVNACGMGGNVVVEVDSISTQGRNAHAIVAQSIGGAGGLVQGVSLAAKNPFAAGSFVIGEAASVDVSVNAAVTTSGDGAFGVIAQSIGGGGILAGDLGATGTGSAIAFPSQGGIRKGYGGDVTVTTAEGASIITSGANAPAIFAQSIGGGGGLVATSGGLMMGSLGGPANAGTILVTNAGMVAATGQGSSAIVTDSEGSNHISVVTVHNQASGTIWGNSTAPAILLAGEGNDNGNGQVVNDGFIANTNGTAIAASNVTQAGPNFAVVANNANAKLYGNVVLGSKGTLTNAGYWGTTDLSFAGNVVNQASGTIGIYGANFNQMGVSVLQGNLSSAGTIAGSVDFVHGASTLLHIKGNADITGGTFSITPTALKPQLVPILEADGALTLDPSVKGVNANNPAVTYQIVNQDGHIVGVQPQTQFGQFAATQGYSSTQQSVGAHLDAGFKPYMSDSMARVYAKLANTDEPHLRQSLASLGNEGVQAVGNAKLLASHAFVDRMNSCPQFDQRGMQLGERDCVWTRAVGNQVDRRGSDDAVGYRVDNYAWQVGGQKGLGDGWFVGGSFAYDRSNLQADTSSVNGQGYTGGLLLKRQLGDWIFSGAVDGGSGHYDSQRQVTLGDSVETASGSFDASHIGVHGRVAHQFAVSAGGTDFYLKPYVDVHATRVHTGAYAETGGDALALNVQSSSQTIYVASPMLEMGDRFDLSNGVQLRAYLSGGAAFYSNDGWGASASLAGLPKEAGTFTATSELPRQRFKFNAGVNVLTTQSLDVRLEYSGEFASGYTSNTAAIKGSWLF